MSDTPSLRQTDLAERVRIRRERLTQLRRNRAFVAGAVILGFWILCAVVGTMLTSKDYSAVNVLASDRSPSKEFWFGTDSLGRDVFARVIVGARPIMIMAAVATILGTVFGTLIGLTTGYLKGKFDAITMRVLDAISALPVLVIALLALAAVDGSSSTITVIIVGFVFTPIIARTVRATVLNEAELDYVAAAKLRSERMPHILFVEILPNVLPPIIVEFTIRLGYAVFAIATLSFLGVGVELGSPNWGSQVAENYTRIYGNIWWSTVFPAAAIATLAIAINLIADGVMEAFDL
ncbi:MAG: ABC transporter permease [Ilumatobacteraceae bacterium]